MDAHIDIFEIFLGPDIDRIRGLKNSIDVFENASGEQIRKFEEEVKSNEWAKKLCLAYDPLEDEPSLSCDIRRIHYATISICLFAVVEYHLSRICHGRVKISVDRPNWGDFKNAIEQQIGISFDSISTFENVTRVRLLNNCFKHNDGLVNAEYAEKIGDTEGEEIAYENVNWDQLIDSCYSFLMDLNGRVQASVGT